MFIWPGSFCSSYPIIRWTGLLPTVCSSVPFIPRANFLLICGVLAEPDWTETRAPREAEPPPRCVARLKILVSVCISFCCCSVCLRIWQQNCHLLCCTCLCLWESCYSISGCCATVGVCVSVCTCACGCRIMANPAPTWPNYFPFLLSSYIFFFFFSCSLQPKPGFYHKAGQSTLPYYYNTIMVTIITVRCSWQFE